MPTRDGAAPWAARALRVRRAARANNPRVTVPRDASRALNAAAAARDPAALAHLAFAPLPDAVPTASHDVLAEHLLRRPAPPPERRAPALNAEMPSPTDVAATAADPAWRFRDSDWPVAPRQPKPELAPAPAVKTELALAPSVASEAQAAALPPAPPAGVRKPRSRRARKKSVPVPSRFCHICARTQKSRKMFCANLRTDVKCRKSVCEPCFIELGWDFAQTPHTWLCPHCRGICAAVPRARCHIYTKTNEKRKAARRL